MNIKNVLKGLLVMVFMPVWFPLMILFLMGKMLETMGEDLSPIVGDIKDKIKGWRE